MTNFWVIKSAFIDVNLHVKDLLDDKNDKSSFWNYHMTGMMYFLLENYYNELMRRAFYCFIATFLL